MNVDIIEALKLQLRAKAAKALSSGQFPVLIRAKADAGEGRDLLSWLAAQEGFPKFFWRAEDSRTVLAYTGTAHSFISSSRCGSAEDWKTIRQWMKEEPGARCWSAGAFHPRIKGPEWAGFDAWAVHFPLIGLEQIKDQHCQLVCQLVLGRKEDPALDALLVKLDELASAIGVAMAVPQVLSRQECPPYDDWGQFIDKALKDIEKGVMSKVVLARRADLLFRHPFAPEAMMSRLLLQPGHAFLFSPAQGVGFLGVTPELLYQRSRGQLDTFAVAGTRPRGKNELEDRKFKDELAASAKDRFEHRQVMDMLLDRLRSLCDLPDSREEGGMLELPHQRHFFQRLHGRILDGVTDERIINALHPTPAVGGVPTERSMDFLASAEPFDRGLFAGTMGWLSRDEVQIAVAIRSCLIRQAQCYIYGGAGVVKGSDAADEWEETELKMKNIMDIINAP